MNNQPEPKVKIKPQVPGITTSKEKKEKFDDLKNEELYFRALHK